MSPAPRQLMYRDLPRNLHVHSSGRFRYRRPDGTYVYLGHDKQAAVEAAIAANAHYASKASLFDKIVQEGSQSVTAAIEEYLKKRLPKYEIKDETRKNRAYILGAIGRSRLGSQQVHEVSTRDLYLYLESLESDWSRQAHRAQLMQFFAWTIETGLRENNPAVAVQRSKAKRARQRLTLDAFKAIRSKAPAWLQNSMDLQLHTLQRPGDVLQMRWDDLTPSTLRVVQRKTGRKIEMQVTGELRAVIDRCRDTLLSPFIVHRRPERLRTREFRAEKRTHHTQVLLSQMESAFAVAREATGLYGEGEDPPTPHEIRSLGASLYREVGWPEDKVQILLGHTEVKMTRVYLAGHEAPWERIEAGLNLAGIRH